MQSKISTSFAVMTYNILVGGNDGRLDAIEAVIRHHAPDVVGLQEANDPAACQAMAARLGMACVMGYSASGYHVALLSRHPILAWGNYILPVFQKGLIEATIDLPGEAQPWHIFVAHLTADFFRGYAAERQRVAEMRAIVACMAPLRVRGVPHLLMGDFNTLNPGEPFNASGLLARVIALDAERAATHQALNGQLHLTYVVPPALHLALPLIRQIPRRRWLAQLANLAASYYLPRWTTPVLRAAGYQDALALTHAPQNIPPTCPLPQPAGRIDYLWADPLLAPRLQGCDALDDTPACPVNRASDHRPLLARFARVPEVLATEAGRRASEMVGTRG